MRRPLPLLLACGLIAAGCATAPPSGVPVAAATPPSVATPAATAVPLSVLNARFEEMSPDRPCPVSWWCSMHSDPKSFRFTTVDGGPSGRFVRGERVKPEPWALVTQALPAKSLQGRRVKVSIDLNTEQSEGEAGPVIRFLSAGGRVTGLETTARKRSPGWVRLSTEVVIPKGTELIEVGLLIEGGGIVDFDNVSVEHSPA